MKKIVFASVMALASISLVAPMLHAQDQGGTIKINAYSADLATGSTIDASGGVAVSAAGKITYGNGGIISITWIDLSRS